MKFTAVFLIFLSLIFSIFTLIIPVDICQAAEITVGDGEEYDYSSIQDAISDANNSDTIRVYNGPYSENIVIDKEITLIGQGSTTIDGESSYEHTITVNAENVSISGFTIKNTAGASQDKSCIVLTYSSGGCTISNNNIKDGGNGIYVVTSTNNIINGNTIEDQTRNGISFTTNANSNQIYSNIIRDNGGHGFKLYVSSDNTFYDNVISNHIQNGVNLALSCSNNIFYQNDFSENEGNAIDEGSNTWYQGNQGNTWDDYNEYDDDEDGIGDNPYTTGGVNDLYPLGVFKNKPEAFIDSISPNPAFEDQTVYFNGHSIGDGLIIEWQWRAGDNTIGYSEDLEHSSLPVGIYTISFRVKNEEDKWSDWKFYTQSLQIKSVSSQEPNQEPEATISDITPNPAIFGETVVFSGIGIDPDEDGSITEYYWSSSRDGFLSDTPLFSRADLSVGEHMIYFKVKDNAGAWSSLKSRTLNINVNTSIKNNNPTGDSGGPYASYLNNSITFDGSQSYDTDGLIVSYSWDFGDGNTSTGETATHTYSRTGEFVVVLTVTDNYGFTDTDVTSATILLDPNSQNGETPNNDGNGNDNGNDKWVIPGFEAILIIFSLIIVVLISKKWKKN